jgi:hypothetical protein
VCTVERFAAENAVKEKDAELKSRVADWQYARSREENARWAAAKMRSWTFIFLICLLVIAVESVRSAPPDPSSTNGLAPDPSSASGLTLAQLVAAISLLAIGYLGLLACQCDF